MVAGKKSDPYVKLSVGSSSWKSEVRKSTLSPLWNQEAFLAVPGDAQRMLQIVVKDYDFGSSNDYMGEAEVDFSNMRLGENAVVMDVPLKNKKGDRKLARIGSLLGSIKLSIKCDFKRSEKVWPFAPFAVSACAFVPGRGQWP